MPLDTPPTHTDPTTFREKMWDVLEHGRGGAGKFVTFAIALLVIISVVSLPLEFLPIFDAYRTTITSVEWVILGLFTVEYAARIYAAPRRLAYIFSWHGLIDLIAIAPAYLHFFDTRVFRILQMGRLARLLKLAEVEAIRYDPDVVKSRYHTVVTLLPGEEIEHVAQKHPIFFIVNLLPVIAPVTLGLGAYALFPDTIAIAFLAVMLIFALAFIVKAWLDYAYDVMLVTNHRIILYNQHFLGSSSHEMYYNDIADITSLHPGILAYFLGYGSLIIKTTSDTEVHMHHVVDHDAIADHINLKKVAHRGGLGGDVPVG